MPAFLIALVLAAPDPVTVLKNHFRSGYGVRFTTAQGAGMPVVKGTIEFGAKGPRASDSRTLKIRTVVVPSGTYMSGLEFTDPLPEGRTWWRLAAEDAEPVQTGSPDIDVFEPLTLRTLLAAAKPHSGRTYKGATTLGALGRLSPHTRASYGKLFLSRYGKSAISWTIWLDGKARVARLRVTTKEPGNLGLTWTTDTRYSGWGAHVHVSAPAASEGAQAKALGE